MKYKLKKDLPFMDEGSIFGTGCWIGGGFGIDLGETHYKEGGSSHNGVKVFEKYENKILEEIISKKDWIEKIPETEYEILGMFKSNELAEKECVDLIRNLLKI